MGMKKSNQEQSKLSLEKSTLRHLTKQQQSQLSGGVSARNVPKKQANAVSTIASFIPWWPF